MTELAELWGLGLERVGASWHQTLRLLRELPPVRDFLATGSIDPYAAVIAFSTVAMILVVFLITYTLTRRLFTEARERRETALRKTWMNWIARYLVHDEEAGTLIRALTGREFRQFVKLLTEYLADLEGEDRHRLAELLFERGYTGNLRRTLRRRKEEERAFAARLLGLLRASESAPALRNLLRDRSETVRFAAASALMQIGDMDAIPALFKGIGRNPLHRERLRYLLFEFGPQVLPKLAAMLTEENLQPWEQVTILEVMRTTVYTDKAMEVLYLATTTPHREVRLAAFKALAEFDDPMLQGFFEDGLADPDPVLQATAAMALGNIGNAEVLPKLRGLLRSPDFWVVKAATESLVALGKEGLTALESERHAGLPPMSEMLAGEVLAGR